jgi:signal transduction histidine kinase
MIRWSPARGFTAYGLVSIGLFAAIVAARPHVVGHRLDSVVWLVLLLPATAVTVLLLARLPHHGITRTMTVYVGCQLTSAGPLHLWKLLGGEGTAAFGRVDNLVWLGVMPVLPLLITLFPDGRATGRVRRVAVRAQVAALGALAVLTLIGVENAAPPTAVLIGVCVGVVVISGVVGAALLVVRAFRDRTTRRDLAPFAVVTALAVLTWLLLPSLEQLVTLPNGAGSGVPALLVTGLPPLGLGYAVLRHQLFGLDVVVRRVAIAALVSVTLVGAYLGCALAVAALTGVPHDSLAAALLPAAGVAMLLMPAYRFALRAADRRLYGDRRDPLALLSSLADELAATTPQEIPARVVDAVSSSLRLPWAALDIDREGRWQRLAEHGTQAPAAATTEFALTHAGECPGRLLVQPRRGEAALGRLDRRVLRQLTVQLGSTAAAIRLVDELTSSRQRLVDGREAERARLRRELHDGLSPSLAGMSLAVKAARKRLSVDLRAADELLETVEVESTSAWRVVRSILDDLRPPGLDELGLLGAVEERGRQLSRPGEFSVEVTGATLPPLPPAVEVAAYRIATEAITNAARHSAAEHCHVQLVADRTLRCTVVDDGIGGTGSKPSGLGLSTMADRAAELGGSVSIASTPGGGTRVVAELPLLQR